MIVKLIFLILMAHFSFVIVNRPFIIDRLLRLTFSCKYCMPHILNCMQELTMRSIENKTKLYVIKLYNCQLSISMQQHSSSASLRSYHGYISKLIRYTRACISYFLSSNQNYFDRGLLQISKLLHHESRIVKLISSFRTDAITNRFTIIE